MIISLRSVALRPVGIDGREFEIVGPHADSNEPVVVKLTRPQLRLLAWQATAEALREDMLRDRPREFDDAVVLSRIPLADE
jgi:hypothetical protein